MRATDNDERYCKQVVDELDRLARERMVAYRDERDIGHVVVLPTGDEPFIEIRGKHDRSLHAMIMGENYVAFIKYAYDGQFKPVYASIVSRQHVYMLNIYMSSREIQKEIYARWGGHGD
jgi:hypothetical protein